MVKTIHYVATFLVVSSATLGTLSLLDRPEETWLRARTVPKVETVIQEGTFEYLRTRRDGQDVFRYEARQNDTKEGVTGTFNLWDSGQNDHHKTIGSDRIVDEKGKPVQQIRPGRLYILAPKRIVNPQPQQIPPSRGPSLQERIREQINPRRNERAEAFAVLINNDPIEARHVRNLRMSYKTLRSRGVDPCNIYVVSDGNKNTECSSNIKINQPGSSAGIRAAFSDIGDRFGTEDTLLVYVTGHGDNNTIPFQGSEGVAYGDLRRMVERLRPNLVIAISDLCYGGGIVREFRGFNGKAISLSPSTASEPTTCNYFTPYFWDAVRLNKSDFDRNGETSIREAFLRAHAFYEVIETNGELTAEETRQVDLRINRTQREIDIPDELFATTGGVYDATLDGRILAAPRINNPTTTASSGRIIELNEGNYETEVVRSNIPVLVDVYAWWCTYCYVLKTALEQELIPRYAGRVKFTSVECAGGKALREYHGEDAEPRIEAVQRYTPSRINGYPTVLLVDHGRVVDTIRGYPGITELEQRIDRAFNLR